MKVGSDRIIFERPTRTRFVGNKNTKEIHRMDAEDKDGNGCQLDTVIKGNHGIEIKNVAKKVREGWDFCAKCWGTDLSEN